MPKGRKGGGHDHRLEALLEAIHNAKSYHGHATNQGRDERGKGGNGKGGDGAVQNFRPGDWMCTCGKHNFAWRQRACYACGATPPGAGTTQTTSTDKSKEIREVPNHTDEKRDHGEVGTANPVEELQRIRKKEDMLRKWKADACDAEEEALIEARLGRLREERARLQPAEVQVRSAAGAVSKARAALEKAKEKVKSQAEHLSAAVLSLEKAEQDRDEAELRLADAEKAMAAVAANDDAAATGGNLKAAEAWRTVQAEARSRTMLPGVDPTVAAGVNELLSKLQELFAKLPKDAAAAPQIATAAADAAAAAMPAAAAGAAAAVAAGGAAATAAASAAGGYVGPGTSVAAGDVARDPRAGNADDGDVDMLTAGKRDARTVEDARAALDRLGKLPKGANDHDKGKGGDHDAARSGSQVGPGETEDREL